MDSSDSSILCLPTELLDQVVCLIPRYDLLAFCCVSKYFNIISTRLLYRDIDLKWHGPVDRCCRTLSANRSAALAVRKFSICCEYVAYPLFLLSDSWMQRLFVA